VGGQYREETYGHNNLQSATDQFYPSRHVVAEYTELHVPIIGPNGASGNNPSLEFIAADRQERYSDFGSTNNPQLGVTWKPLTGTRFRGTFGTSFVAPQLYEVNPVPSQVVVEGLTDPTKGPGNCTFSAVGGYHFVGASCTDTMITFGGNPNLEPEKARSWTVGLALDPEPLPGFRAELTYYDVVFNGQADRNFKRPSGPRLPTTCCAQPALCCVQA
jgi:outer membrane receptor protein involved in Fe transport